MPFLLKDTIHETVAKSIYDEILSGRGNYYYFIGRVLDWSNINLPDTPIETRAYEYELRNNIINFKKVGVSDISLVVPRINWTTGTVYDQFDEDYSSTYLSSTGASNIRDAQFYVLTDTFQVYKCLFNNNGVQSTEKPFGTDPVPITYADGYVWKYLFTVPLSLRNKFLTDEFIPVQKSIQSSFYSDGAIDRVTITSPGSGYLGNSEVSLTVSGTFAAGNGNVVANLTPVFNANGQFIDVIIDNPGNNYSTANIIINDLPGTGTGYYNANSTAVLTPVIFNGKVDRILIEDPGLNYSSNLQTTLVVTGDGANAVLTPYINQAGQLEDVIIENRGDGYTYAFITVVGDGSNANVTADLTTGDLNTVQSIVELAAVDGAIYNFRIVHPGNNYTAANITVTGDGSGFLGNVNLSNTNTISSIEIINPGSGYTHANVVITGNGSNANIQAVFSPTGGHGFNPVKELFAKSLMIYTTINNDKIHGLTIDNDYRQIGLAKDIMQYSSDKLFTDLSGTPCFVATVNALGSIQKDDILTVFGDSSKEFEVIHIDVENKKLLLLNKNNYNLNSILSLYGPDYDETYLVQSIASQPTINKFSGDILFIDNRTHISTGEQQIVTLRTVINF